MKTRLCHILLLMLMLMLMWMLKDLKVDKCHAVWHLMHLTEDQRTSMQKLYTHVEMNPLVVAMLHQILCPLLALG
jgi:hypothetical protein